ncbi:BnaAnng11000D [Brassica napus]|uniref:BnaAnng11000D protein n=1 Tax=Brassica napus TaxID=3708 RepID=A0A078IS77_BRANA|nr:BnaAnng11000D [Brassica napus]
MISTLPQELVEEILDNTWCRWT